MSANALSRSDGAGDGDVVRWSDLERALARGALKALDVWAVPEGTTLGSLSESWLEAMSGQLDVDTQRLYRLHLSTHLGPHFGALPGITKATIADYGRRRLRVVKRATLQKERSTLRGFLGWCLEQGYLTEMPEFPALPRRAAGTAFSVRRRGAATALSQEECRAVIEALPERSRARPSQPSFPVRARFIVAYETALRPATLDALSVPEHYSRGAETLVITDEIDKARFGREVPLSAAAREALDSVAGRTGILFGDHDYRYPLEMAAKAVLPAAKARTFTAYDFRHARLTELAEGGNLPGVAYLAGHKRVTTTSIYVKPGLRAAKSVLGASDPTAGEATARVVRSVPGLSAAALRALEPPSSEGQAMAEWQVLINALADQRETEEQAAATKVEPKRRAASPRDPAALDELVERAIASGTFSAQLDLRGHVGCSLGRLRASLARLAKAGRVAKVPHPVRGDIWQVCSSPRGTLAPAPIIAGLRKALPGRESRPGTQQARTAASPR